MVMKLFDKIINIDLINHENTSYSIKCPETGVKPDIKIEGEFISSLDISSIKVKLTNVYLKDNISNYMQSLDGSKSGYVRITAGYKNSLRTDIIGECLNASPESPSPDGVTCFELLLGKFDLWIKTIVNVNYDKGTLLSTIFKDIADKLNLNLKISSDITEVTSIAFGWNGYAKDFLSKLKTAYPDIVIRPDGQNLYVYNGSKGTSVLHTLKYITSAKKDASGFNIQAPWIPNIRPGDNVKVDPIFYKSSFGSQSVSNDTFNVIHVGFDFGTCDDSNNMDLLLVNL